MLDWRSTRTARRRTSTMAANLLGSGVRCDQADDADGRSGPVDQAVTDVPV